MLCTNCNAPIKPGKKFCGQCGTPAPPQQRICGVCQTKLEDDEQYCPDCGTKHGLKTPSATPTPAAKTAAQKPAAPKPATPKPAAKKPAAPKDDTLAGSMLSSESRSTLRFSKTINDEEKAIVRKLKKKDAFFLYDKAANVVYLKQDATTIYAYAPSHMTKPIAAYTISPVINQLWEKFMCHRMFFFYSDQDAFFAWCDYIFISVYQGEIRWSAADSRSEWHLPGEHSDCDITYPGIPELTFLPNGHIQSKSFKSNTEYKVEKGVFIPV